MSPFHLPSCAASDNATSIVQQRAVLLKVIGSNTNDAARWLKLYDQKNVPTATDAPALSLYLPPQTTFAIDLECLFEKGVGFRLTAGGADSDNNAAGAGDLLGLNLIFAG